jgi:hypothetical protein
VRFGKLLGGPQTAIRRHVSVDQIAQCAKYLQKIGEIDATEHGMALDNENRILDLAIENSLL